MKESMTRLDKMETIGGQAVMEGVMMKNGSKVAVAVRKNGKIIVEKLPVKLKDSQIPFIRGVVNLFIMMSIGTRSLLLSTKLAAIQKEEEPGNFALGLSFIIAVVLGLFLFKFLPLGFAQVVDSQVVLSSGVFNIVEGLVKMSIFLGYILLISRMRDVQRLFQYHGAEHKVVNCYEAGKKLTVKNVKPFTTVNRRCGTTFVFLVLLLSIVVYLFIPKDYSFGLKFLLRVLLLPVIASLSYELLKLGAKFNSNALLQVIIWPGLKLQAITTREPDEEQIEVGIASLKAVL